MRKPCCHKEDTNKGAWSEQEDQKLIDYIRQHGEGSWRTLPQAAGLLRCGKSCRLRWINYLRPHLKRGNFAEDEEDLIIKLHALLGNRWSLIAGRLPGRTDNEIKNYWNSHLRRKLVKLGIDPNNHRLNQNLIHPQSPKISTSVTSSALKNQAEEISTGIKRSQVCIEQVACNAEDRVEDNCCLRFHDLNLNLSIPTPSVAEMEEGRNANCRSNKSMEMEITQSPGTLLLFR